MIPREKGLRRPFSASRDTDGNRYDEILRGVAGQFSRSGFRVGAIYFSNQTTTAGGFGAFEGEYGNVGMQGFLFVTNRDDAAWSGSLFGRVKLPTIEAGGEWALSEGQAWLVWMRFPGRVKQAMVVYDGETNFFAPYGGQLYRGIQGKQGFVWGLETKQGEFELIARSEGYTNKRTGYATFKSGIIPALVKRMGVSWIGVERVSSSVSMDIRTNTFFFSYGEEVVGWLFSPLKWELRTSQDTYHEKRGSEYHARISGYFKNWSFSIWHVWLQPLKENPLSLTFPPVESGEMESMWFYHPTEISCFVVRYRRREMAVAARVLTWDTTVRFALSVQWEW